MEARPKHVAFIAGHEIWTYQRLSLEAERLGQARFREASGTAIVSRCTWPMYLKWQ
jgi:hypothetical protein